MANDSSALRDLLVHTRDGEWGADAPSKGMVPMRVIRGTDFDAVRLGSLADVPIRYIAADVAERKSLCSWDVLIETAGGSKGRPTGRTLLVHPRVLAGSNIPVTCASFARFLRFDRTRVDPRYVFWYLQYLYSVGEMDQHQVQHTGIARFQFTRFAENVRIPLPTLLEQHAIAHILGVLDDKIELNRRMNETLEAMARAIFQSWFVDFDPVRAKAEGRATGLPKAIVDLFPDRFEDSELGEIPAG
jgi:type I restriction enzyme S subunit